MDAKRQADELASRCMALIIFHQHKMNTRPDGQPILSEIRAIALEARKCGISSTTIATKLLAELRARYEPESAGRLQREFVAMLDGDFQSAPVLA